MCAISSKHHLCHQNTESAISRDYVRALRNVLNNDVRDSAVLSAPREKIIYRPDQDGLHRIAQRPGRGAVLGTVHIRISSPDFTCAVH